MFYSKSTELNNTNIWGISTHIKCGVTNVSEVDTYKIYNRRVIYIVQYVLLGIYRGLIKFGKSGVTLVSRGATPQLGVKIWIFEDNGWRISVQYTWSGWRKIILTGKCGGLMLLFLLPTKLPLWKIYSQWMRPSP